MAIEMRDGLIDGPAGLRLYYRDWRPAVETGPPLLLLHGLASASRIWDLVAPALAERRRVVALDQRGHGRSDKPDTGYDFNSIVADDLAAMQALGLQRPVVVGHSWGASVVMALAATRPESVSGVVLVDGGVLGLSERPGWSWERVARELAPPNYAGTPRTTFLERLRQGSHAAFWRPELAEIILNIVELRADDTVGPRLTLANHLRILRAMWEEPPTAHLAALRCPLLAVLAEGLAGDHQAADRLADKRRGTARLLAHQPAATIHWLADTVHDIPLQRPARLAELIAVHAELVASDLDRQSGNRPRRPGGG